MIFLRCHVSFMHYCCCFKMPHCADVSGHGWFRRAAVLRRPWHESLDGTKESAAQSALTALQSVMHRAMLFKQSVSLSKHVNPPTSSLFPHAHTAASAALVSISVITRLRLDVLKGETESSFHVVKTQTDLQGKYTYVWFLFMPQRNSLRV